MPINGFRRVLIAMQTTQLEPALGVIGGSGLYEMEGLEKLQRHAIETPFGAPSDEIVEGLLNGRRICFLPRHGRGHRLLAHEINHRANIWALRSLNVRWVVSVTAVGSLRENLPPCHAVVPDQLVDRTGKADLHTFFGNGIGAHISFADPYSDEMQRLLVASLAKETSAFQAGGTYIAMNGPAFSTRAEANMHRMLGFDIIGMTNGGEARLCREAEIAAATLAMVTDFDCWKTDEPPVNTSTIIANLTANSRMAHQVIRHLIDALPHTANWPEHQALDEAILTPRALWPEETVQALRPILNRFC